MLAEKYPQLAALAAAVPKPVGMTFSYGTAGFRTKGDALDSTVYRTALLAVLRSRQLDGKATGICITASHNPMEDNGIKFADPDGGMLAQEWEPLCTRLANAADDEVVATLQAICDEQGIDLTKRADPLCFIARDTRESGERLIGRCRDAMLALGGNVLDYGVMTTPQLHSVVRMYNAGKREWATESGYYDMLAAPFAALIAGYEAPATALIVDAANGVGGDKLRGLLGKLAVACGKGSVHAEMDVRNDGHGDGAILNFECGADHAQKYQLPPRGVDASADAERRLASYDGDADRIVYHYFDAAGEWHLIDGDKIAVLFAQFLKSLLDATELADATIGVVQTAYANGASTRYISETLAIEVAKTKTGSVFASFLSSLLFFSSPASPPFTRTPCSLSLSLRSVKHLHHKAIEYDIGVYFEANGHGTVIFNQKLIDERLRPLLESEPAGSSIAIAAKALCDCHQVLNQAVGDALSDMLLIEAILCRYNITLETYVCVCVCVCGY